MIDLASMVNKNQMPQADGTLAYSAFKDRLLQMDYKNHVVSVSEPLTSNVACPKFCGDVTMPTFGKGRPHVLATTGFSVNGKPIIAQIDTLYSGTMLIYRDSVAKLGLQQENTATATRFFNFTDGGVPMRESKAHTEAFGHDVLARNVALFFATPQVHVPDGMFDGTVGAGLFVGHVIHLDLHANHYPAPVKPAPVLSIAPAPSEPVQPEANRHGTIVRHRDQVDLTPEQRARMEADMAAAREQIREATKKFQSPEFKKQMADMQRQVAEATKQMQSAEVQRQMKMLQSPEFKKQMADMQRQIKEATKQFDNHSMRLDGKGIQQPDVQPAPMEKKDSTPR